MRSAGPPAVAAIAGAAAQGPAYVEGDLSTRGHVFILVAAAVGLVYVFVLVRHRRMAGKYALLWSAMALVFVVLAVWPGLLSAVSELVGVHYPPTLLLLIMTGFLFLFVIHLSYEVSRLEDRSRTLAEEVALLRAERELDLPPAGTPAAATDEPG